MWTSLVSRCSVHPNQTLRAGCTYSAIRVASEGVCCNEPVEGTGPGRQASGDHVVDGVRDAESIGGTSALRELLQEGKAQTLLHRPRGRRAVAAAPLGQPPPPRAAPL